MPIACVFHCLSFADEHRTLFPPQVVAPAGSTLVFFESLLHSGGSHHSYNGKERVLILASFLPTMYQSWNDYDAYMPFVQTLNEVTPHRTGPCVCPACCRRCVLLLLHQKCCMPRTSCHVHVQLQA